MSDSPGKSFTAILALFWDILRLRRGPQDLPVSWPLLGTTIVAQAALALTIAGMLPPLPETLQEAGQPPIDEHSIALLVIELVVALLWGWAVLRIAGKAERYLQTMTALFGCQLLLQPFLTPAWWAVGFYGKESTENFLALLFVMVLGVWGLVAMVKVLRSATDWPALFCAFLVFGQSVLAYVVAKAVFPELFS